MTDMNRILTLNDAAEQLKCSRSTVYRLIGDGAIATVSIRGALRIMQADLDDYVASQRRKADRREKFGFVPINVTVAGSLDDLRKLVEAMDALVKHLAGEMVNAAELEAGVNALRTAQKALITGFGIYALPV